MTLQTLSYFVAAAESGNFTKAAAQCFISQPALSRAVAELEAEIGLPLFVRGGKMLTLTAAGTACLEEARRLLIQAEGMVGRVREAARGIRRLAVGYIVLGHLNVFRRYVDEAAQLADRFPEITFDTVYADMPDLKARLLDGRLNLAVLPESCAGDLPEHDRAVIGSGGAAVIVPRGHRLFGRSAVRIADLRGEDFVLYDPHELPLVNRAYVSACVQAGFQPSVVSYGRKMGDLVAQVAGRNAVAFGSTAFRYIEAPDIRVIPISERVEGTDIVLVALRQGQAMHELMLHLTAIEPVSL